MNDHTPPTESEVRASLWQRCQRLQDRLDERTQQCDNLKQSIEHIVLCHAVEIERKEATIRERTQQRNDLLSSLMSLVDYADQPGPARQRRIDNARQTIQVTREEMEVE